MGNRKTREKLYHDVGTGCLFSKHTQDKGELDSGYACHFAITLDAVQKIIIHAKQFLEGQFLHLSTLSHSDQNVKAYQNIVPMYSYCMVRCLANNEQITLIFFEKYVVYISYG